MILKICPVLRVANSKDEYNGLRFEDTHGFKCTVLCVCVCVGGVQVLGPGLGSQGRQ